MQSRLVWDLPTRLFHWLLVASLIGQYVTAEVLKDAMQWHFYLGYFTLGLLLFRLVWGFVGPEYARFSNFVKGPASVLHYARTLRSADAPRHAGHNPMGGWAVLAILGLVATQAISGLFLTDDVFLDGPYRSAVSESTQKLMNIIHHQLFNVLLAMIVLHIVAIVAYGLFKKQPLASSMVNGKKQTDQTAIRSSKILVAIIVAAICAGVVYYIVEVAPPAPVEDAFFY